MAGDGALRLETNRGSWRRDPGSDGYGLWIVARGEYISSRIGHVDCSATNGDATKGVIA